MAVCTLDKCLPSETTRKSTSCGTYDHTASASQMTCRTAQDTPRTCPQVRLRVCVSYNCCGHTPDRFSVSPDIAFEICYEILRSGKNVPCRTIVVVSSVQYLMFAEAEVTDKFMQFAEVSTSVLNVPPRLSSVRVHECVRFDAWTVQKCFAVDDHVFTVEYDWTCFPYVNAIGHVVPPLVDGGLRHPRHF